MGTQIYERKEIRCKTCEFVHPKLKQCRFNAPVVGPKPFPTVDVAKFWCGMHSELEPANCCSIEDEDDGYDDDDE